MNCRKCGMCRPDPPNQSEFGICEFLEERGLILKVCIPKDYCSFSYKKKKEDSCDER